MYAQAEGSGPQPGVSGHRVEPAEPSGGQLVRSQAGAPPSARERRHRAGRGHRGDALQAGDGHGRRVQAAGGEEPARGTDSLGKGDPWADFSQTGRSPGGINGGEREVTFRDKECFATSNYNKR